MCPYLNNNRFCVRGGPTAWDTPLLPSFLPGSMVPSFLTPHKDTALWLTKHLKWLAAPLVVWRNSCLGQPWAGRFWPFHHQSRTSAWRSQEGLVRFPGQGWDDWHAAGPRGKVLLPVSQGPPWTRVRVTCMHTSGYPCGWGGTRVSVKFQWAVISAALLQMTPHRAFFLK